MMPQPYKWRYIDPKMFLGLEDITSDECVYYMDRDPGGWDRSEANNRISNYQKSLKMRESNPAAFAHKQPAIELFADDLCRLFVEGAGDRRPNVAIVPIPSSKRKDDPYYDDRNLKVARIVASRVERFVVEDPFEFDGELEKSKYGGPRDSGTLFKHISYSGIADGYAGAYIIDDVFTRGGHYVVCRDLIRAQHPDLPIMGIFWAKQRNDDFIA